MGSSVLNVYSRERIAEQNSSLLWAVEGDQGNQWLQEQIDISVVANDFEVTRNKNKFLVSCNTTNIFYFRFILKENLIHLVLRLVQLH